MPPPALPSGHLTRPRTQGVEERLGEQFPSVEGIRRGRGGMVVGAIAPNAHEGSRSEYLAQCVFASFGAAVAIPHQEDSGIDLHCTLTERVG